ncbi:hypothetical protein D082_34460 [Synechocystis sp. PCC 6714]|nr:hypothetical protein D082_34460 [Synechocystis sp. PCC 6714]
MEKNQSKHGGLDLHSKAIAKVWGQSFALLYICLLINQP